MALTEVEKIYQASADIVGDLEITSDSNTGIKPYSVCHRHYEQARDEMIRGYAWNEATEYALCLESSVKPTHSWTYKFTLPSNILRLITTTRPKMDWRVAGDFIYTDYKFTPDTYTIGSTYYAGQLLSYNSTTYLINTTFTATAWATDAYSCTSKGGDYGYIELEYVKSLTDPTDWSVDLRKAIILNLATYIVIPLTGDYERKQALTQELYNLVLPRAHSLDAMQGKPKQFFYSEFIDARDQI